MRVRHGSVVAVEEYDESLGTAPGAVSLAEDEVLLPGLVDTHVHVNDPGRADWEGFPTATRAAAAGGVTTILDMPLNSIPPTLDAAALDAKRGAAVGRVHVDVGFWGGAVPGNRGRLGPLWRDGVFGFKCFLSDSGVPEFPALEPGMLDEVTEEVASFGGLLLVHAEDPGTLRDCDPASTRYADFLASRPEASEQAAVATVLDSARTSGCRVHVVHVSAAAALAEIAAARAEGLAVSAETCPHYLSFTADDVPAGATEFKCCPPIRAAAHRDALWQGLAEGTLDIVVSDHSPCPPELKNRDSGGFADAWGGIGSVQLGLPAVWHAARERGHDLADVVGWMCTGPADFAGLPRKGRISPGADADFCVLAPDETFTVEPRHLQQRHALTPYNGRVLTGVVRQTWLRGTRIDLDGPPHGRLLRRRGAG